MVSSNLIQFEVQSLNLKNQTKQLIFHFRSQGLVLLTEDARLTNSPSGITKEFSSLCQRSTEYHFPTFEQQVEAIKRDHLQPGNYLLSNKPVLHEKVTKQKSINLGKISKESFYLF
jgi:hypothetical protein